MTDQPPLPPQPPSQPYGAPSQPYGAPGGYYPPPPPQGGGRLKWVLIGIAALVLLTCGGCFALVALAISEGSDTIKRELDQIEPSRPVVVTEGAAFTVGDLTVAPGWRVVSGGSTATVEGLRASTQDDDAILDSLFVIDLEFQRGNRVLGELNCTSVSLEREGYVDLTCSTTSPRIARAQQIIAQTPLG